MTMNGKIRAYLFCFSIFIFLLAASSIHKTPIIIGDGLEYLLITEAFLERGEVNIHSSDIENFRSRNTNNTIENINAVTATDILSEQHSPFKQAKTGTIYSFHFWLFPVIFSPFVAFARFFELADTTGYLLGNIFFITLATRQIFLSQNYNLATAFSGVVLLFSVGGIYYLRWPHPEIFSASMLFVGCIFLREQKWKLAALFFAIPGQQNPPILLALPIIFILDARHVFYKKYDILAIIRYFFPWLAIGLLAVLNLVFFYLYFGVFNLIAVSGYSDFRLISLDRLISLYFDPNLGIFWTIPFACIFSILLFFSEKQQKIPWRWMGIFFSISMIFAIPSLSATNWNHGMTAISRYGFWCAVPVIFCLLEIYQQVATFSGKVIIFFSSILQVFLIYFNGGATPTRHEFEFSPMAQFILRKFPQWYSPSVNIFIERGQHNFGLHEHGVYYWIESGNVRKIIIYKTPRKDIYLTCDNGYPAWNFITSVDAVELDWTYWNLQEGCHSSLNNGLYFFGNPIPIHSGQTIFSTNHLLTENPGWYHDEKTHRWSSGNVSMLRFISPTALNAITIHGFPFGEQRVNILLNHSLYFSGKIPNDGLFKIELPKTTKDNMHTYTLQFQWLDAKQASEEDPRTIAFAIKQIDFK